MTSLEVGSVDDFIAEIGKGTAYFWGVDQPMQNEKKEPLLGLLIVMTTATQQGAIIRYVENLGLVSTKDQKVVEDALKQRTQRMKDIQKHLADKGIGYASGLWSNE